jgi:rRNA-processing protein FCF1
MRLSDIDLDRCDGILFDTSFLIEAIKTPGVFDFLRERFGSIPFIVPKSILGELEKMMRRGKGEKGRLASLLLRYIDEANFTVLPSRFEEADKDIFEYALSGKYIVATCDRDLRYRLTEKGVRVIYLKDGYPHYD